MKKRLLSLFLSLLLLLTAIPAVSAAEEEAWWEQDYWSKDVLTELGAVPPVYSAETGYYEISSPEQLLYLSGLWDTEDHNSDGMPDAPCNGTYVLTADLDMSPILTSIGTVLTEKTGSETKGYMPPIGPLADTTEEEGVHCAFFGTFDGQGHSIRNLRVVRMGAKYAGLFGNIGHDYGEGYVRNLAILDAEIVARASCGILAGSLYGDADNIVCTGTIECMEKTAGGLAGKIKKNDNGYIGIARNCFVYCNIVVRGKGEENGAAGGITSSNSGGGQIVNCFAGGSITVRGESADSVAGITGNLKGGTAVDNTVMMLTKIDGGDESTNIGLFAGNFSGESGSHIHNNYVWEGTRLLGGISSDHPEAASFETVSSTDITSKSFYTDRLGWDFENVWEWVGEESSGYPMIKGFTGAVDMDSRIRDDLMISIPVLSIPEPMVNSAYEGEQADFTLNLLLPDGVSLSAAALYYGTGKQKSALKDSVPMTMTEKGLEASFLPDPANDTYYYYFRADIGDKTYTLPTEGTLRLDIVSATSKYGPTQITLTPGSDYSKVCANWITEADGLSAELRYRHAGGSQWENTIPVTEKGLVQVLGDHGTFSSYSVDLEDLEPDTAYEYVAVTNDGTRDYVSPVYSFTTLPDSKSFAFAVISDLQSTNEEGYLNYYYTDATFLTDNLHPNFIANVGDLTEDDTMSEWKFMYNTIGNIYSSQLTAFAPGNHEGKGDVIYSHFKGRTNLPKGIDDEMLAEATSAFVVGDVCFVTLNTDPYTGVDGTDAAADKMNYYQMQKEWAKQVFEDSGCTFRIIFAHAGLVQKDDAATAFLEKMCDELDVDLYFNGHIHNYFRATVDGDGNPRELGDATTFVTISPMGNKFDDYGHEIDDLLQFQTGGMADPRQYFAYVEAEEGALTVSVYQRTSDGAASKKNCSDYTLIDSFRLEKSPAATEPDPAPVIEEPGEVPVPATEPPAPEPISEPDPEPTPQPPVPDASPSRPGLALMWGLICIAAIAGIVVFVILYNRKRKD